MCSLLTGNIGLTCDVMVGRDVEIMADNVHGTVYIHMAEVLTDNVHGTHT